jgi:hypothetical protein
VKEQILELFRQRNSPREIARICKCSRQYVYAVRACRLAQAAEKARISDGGEIYRIGRTWRVDGDAKRYKTLVDAVMAWWRGTYAPMPRA